jgi:arylsulfatase A-like enzyme
LQAPEELLERYRRTGELTTAVSAIYAMIERMDAGIGQLREALESLGLLDDTLVVFTSDNGPAMGGTGDDCTDRYNGPFSGTKYDVLEGGIRVPAIVRWPGGLQPGSRCDDLIHFTDWLPTLYGLTGHTLPEGLSFDGEDVLHLLRGEQGSEPARVRYWQWNRYAPVAHANAAMREGRWKLYWPPIPEASEKDPADNVPYERFMLEAHTVMDIDTTLPWRGVPPPGAPRLFDLEADLAEATDLSSAHPERVEEMRRRWDAWFEGVMAEWRRASPSGSG